MPHVEVTLIEGRTPEQIRALLAALHAAVETSIGAPPESIRVVAHEVPPTHWSSGGTTIAERRRQQAQAEGNG